MSILVEQINLQQVTSHEYTASWHKDWTAGPAIHGGCIAAVIHQTAIHHLSSTLKELQQPDILSLHFDFLTACTTAPFEISVIELKIGKIISTFRLELKQKSKICVIAIATSINFDVPIGPTCDYTGYKVDFQSIPDFKKVKSQQVEDNWIPGSIGGQIYPFTNRMLILYPRIGIPENNTLDIWSTFTNKDEKIQGSYLSLMADCLPSMSDTILQNGGIFDAHQFFQTLKKGADEHPGIPTKVQTSFKDAAKATIWNNTVSLDIDFKKETSKRWYRLDLYETSYKEITKW